MSEDRTINRTWLTWEYLEARDDRKDQERKMAEMTDQQWSAFVDDMDRRVASPAVEAEMRGYFDALGRRGSEAAYAMGVPQEAIMSGLVGIARIRVTDGMWEPAQDGARAFVTPVRVHAGNAPHEIESTDPERAVRKGEIVDIVAWHPERPGRWALRTGDAVALGAVERRLSDEPPQPLQVHNGPLAWLRAGGEGIVLLTSDKMERRLVLGHADRLVVEDPRLRDELRHRNISVEAPQPERTLNLAQRVRQRLAM